MTPQRRLASKLLLLTCLLLASPPTGAQQDLNAIVAVQTRNTAQQLEVRIEMQHAIAEVPAHFSTTDPARIVIDLPPSQTMATPARAAVRFPATVRQGILDSYAIAYGDTRTRLVLNLMRNAHYRVLTEDSIVRVLIDKAVHQFNDNVSLNLQNVEVRALLQIFAEIAGINIVASDSVSGKITLRLQDVAWQQALEIILQARGLEQRRHGSVLWIAPRAELLAQEKDTLEQQTQIAELEHLQTEVFQLNYQRADSFRKLLGVRQVNDTEVHPHLLSRRGSTIVDQRTNQLFVTDTRRVLDNVRALLAKVDVPARQVLIEARIVEADDSFSRNLGARMNFSASTARMALGNNLERSEVAAVNLPASAIGSMAAGSLALSLFSASAKNLLNLELSALEAEGQGQIISSPRVVTADQQAAIIEQGEEIPYQQSTSSGATSVAFKKANLKLEVTPQITPDGHIILNVDISKDSRGVTTPGGLAINNKHVKTQVQVEDGGTVVIGGIYTQTEADTASRIPLLSRLPLLGWLFKNTSKTANKTELLIFMTPKIVTTADFQQ